MIFKQFLVGERTYVANLERLFELAKKVGTNGSLEFLILDELLKSLSPVIDMQRLLLLSMEMTARKPSKDQKWELHFEAWSRKSSAYVIFINSSKAARTHLKTTLDESQGLEAEDGSFILKDFLQLLSLPLQRLPIYPGFLQVLPLLFLFLICSHTSPADPNQEIRQQGELSGFQMRDLSAAMGSLEQALQTIDLAVKSQEFHQAHTDLVARIRHVEDFKVAQSGELLLFDVLDVYTKRSITVQRVCGCTFLCLLVHLLLV